jgi:hypothetical protein
MFGISAKWDGNDLETSIAEQFWILWGLRSKASVNLRQLVAERVDRRPEVSVC